MPDISFSITDTQKKALDTVISGGVAGIGTWADNSVTVRATKAQNVIIQNLLKHCNDNNIALATGADAQVDQAYALGIAHTAGSGGIIGSLG